MRSWERQRSCEKCKADFITSKHDLKRGGGRGKFCSRKCAASVQFAGKSNPRWNGGRTFHEAGYILVKAPTDHPHKTKAGYIREHRLVMEQTIGRYLLPSEDVDHINGVKTDNRPENLQIIPSRGEHVKLEYKRGVYKHHLGLLKTRPRGSRGRYIHA